MSICLGRREAARRLGRIGHSRSIAASDGSRGPLVHAERCPAVWRAVRSRWPADSTLTDCKTRGFFLTFRIAWRRVKVYKTSTHGTGRGWQSFARVMRCHLFFGQNLTCEPTASPLCAGITVELVGEEAFHPKGGNVPGCLGGPDRERTCLLGRGPIL